MYWRQAALSLVPAAGIAYVLMSRGGALSESLLVGLVVYIGFRWLFSWGHRIRYWLQRGTGGRFYRRCPTCNRRRHRLSGDWILKCRKCGWTAGWPLVRWLRYSVPARQLYRTVVGPRAVVVVLAVTVLAVGGPAAVLAGVPQSDSALSGGATDGTNSNTETPPPTVDRETSTAPTTAANSHREINTQLAEQLIIERANEVREAHDLSTLTRGPVPDRFAEQHSEDMARYDFFGHQGPNGTSEHQRMQTIVEACGGAASENTHQSPKDHRVQIWQGEEIVDVYNESDLARYAIEGWMNSPGHRENLLDSRWTITGVGVYVDNPDDKIYITMVYC